MKLRENCAERWTSASGVGGAEVSPLSPVGLSRPVVSPSSRAALPFLSLVAVWLFVAPIIVGTRL
jgi:hypothetical protein